jgi:hypothetical protein
LIGVDSRDQQKDRRSRGCETDTEPEGHFCEKPPTPFGIRIGGGRRLAIFRHRFLDALKKYGRRSRWP